MVLQEETLGKKKKKFLWKRKGALSKMPRTRRKEEISHNTTNMVTKCNHMTDEVGKNRQKQTKNFFLNTIENVIIDINKMKNNIENK